MEMPRGSQSVTKLNRRQDAQSFSVRIRKSDDCLHVWITGAILGKTVGQRAYLKALSKSSASHWILHLDDLQVLSIRGLRLLLKLAMRLHKRGKRLTVQEASPMFWLLVSEMRVDAWFAN